MGEMCGEKMLVKERSRKLSLGMNINKHSNCNGASVVAQRRVDLETALQPYNPRRRGSEPSSAQP